MFREGQVLSDLIQMNISSFFSLSLSMFQFFDFIVYNDDDRQKNPEEWNYLTHTGSQLQSRIEKDEKKKKWTCGKKHTENNWIKTAPTTSNKNRSYTQTKRKRKNRHEQENISIRVIVKVKLFGCVSSLLLFSYVFFFSPLLHLFFHRIPFHFLSFLNWCWWVAELCKWNGKSGPNILRYNNIQMSHFNFCSVFFTDTNYTHNK